MISKVLKGTLLIGATGAAAYGVYKLINYKKKKMSQELITYLTQIEAIERRGKILGGVTYDVLLKLLKETYEGIIKIKFQAMKEEDIILDFTGDEIVEIVINKKKVPKKDGYHNIGKGFKVNLEKKYLKDGVNEVEIKIKTKYVNNGNGFHCFIDTDGKQYIYSNLEPNHAHKGFPCFDQPDIKAEIKFRVIAPTHGNVISNEKIEEKLTPFVEKSLPNVEKDFYQDIIESKTEYSLGSFVETRPLSTYLYAIIAGDFVQIKNTNEEGNQKKEMSLYCRESLVEHLKKQAEEIFEITIKAMDFYNEFFGYDMPFPKYDQIFCPEFNVGAMENPGAVTFNDRYIFKDKVLIESRSRRAVTITHELCHMGFGDLVTMKGWNGLGLNESFADFIAFYCLSKIKLSFPLSDMNRSFNNNKGGGYRDDQLSTTHPISGEVKNTEEAETIFDGITYSKGGAVLKQLLCLMGHNNFSKAMSNYFHMYHGGNTTLDDFIKELNNNFVSSFTLNDGKKEGIETAGLNECEANGKSDNKDEKATLEIIQRPVLAEFPTLRHHKMNVGLIKENGEIDSKEVLLNPEKITTVEYNGKAGYKAILLNYMDESFIKLIVDQESIKFFEQNVYLIKDKLSKTMILRSFYDMVRDAKYSSKKFVDMICNNIEKFTETEIINDALGFTSISIDAWTPLKNKEDLYNKMFKVLYEGIKKIDEKEENLILLLQGFLVKFAHADECLDIVYKGYEDQDLALKKCKLTVYNKGDIVKSIFKSKKFSVIVKKDILSKQLQIDKSDVAKQNQMYCEACLCTKEERMLKGNNYLMDPNNKDSNHLKEAFMEGFNSEDLELSSPFVELYFDNLLNVFKTRELEFAQNFANCLFPITDDFSTLNKSMEKIMETPGINTFITLYKFLKEQIDMTNKRIKTAECFLKDINVIGA